jgi:hypothetical protein
MLIVKERAAASVSTPSTGRATLFVDSTGSALSLKDDAGAVTVFGAGSVAGDAIWDAAGDLAVGTGSNTAARLAVGTVGQVLTSNGTTATWAAPAGGVSDGDKGDIVVSSSGTVWSLDSSVVTAAAKTVLDDATVAAMVNTLGGASSTGSGGLVRATSPALVTPDLGTPAGGTLTNCAGLPSAGVVDLRATLHANFASF